MRGITKVAIGIQARSGSTRLPNKIMEKVGDLTVLERILQTADGAAQWLNFATSSTGIQACFAVLIPTGDPLASFLRNKSVVVEGPEQDVLKRYRIYADDVEPDYIVRLTSDCPLLPAKIVTDHIKLALSKVCDYLANVDSRCRTSIDGHDVEVMSRRALVWADENATSPEDREHVTPILRSETCPRHFSICHTMGLVDMSQKKLSIDTPADLKIVQDEHARIVNARSIAERIYGKRHVYTL